MPPSITAKNPSAICEINPQFMQKNTFAARQQPKQAKVFGIGKLIN